MLPENGSTDQGASPMTDPSKPRVRYSQADKQAFADLYGARDHAADPETLALGAEAARELLPAIDGALELLALYHLYNAMSSQRALAISPILRPLFDDDELEPIAGALHDANLAIIGTFTPTDQGLAVLDLLIPQSAPHTYHVRSMDEVRQEMEASLKAHGLAGLHKLYNLAARAAVDDAGRMD
jgi:hypothetical protein